MMTELLKIVAMLCVTTGSDPYLVQATQMNCHEHYVKCMKESALEVCMERAREKFAIKRQWVEK